MLRGQALQGLEPFKRVLVPDMRLGGIVRRGGQTKAWQQAPLQRVLQPIKAVAEDGAFPDQPRLRKCDQEKTPNQDRV